MKTALILSACIPLYSAGWYFAFKCVTVKGFEYEMMVLFSAFFGVFVIPVCAWYALARPPKSERLKRMTEELEARATAIERMARAVKSIPADHWQVVRAEHLDQVVEKLTKSQS